MAIVSFCINGSGRVSQSAKEVDMSSDIASCIQRTLMMKPTAPSLAVVHDLMNIAGAKHAANERAGPS